MRISLFASLIALPFSMLAGCSGAPKTLYQWGNYQPALLAYAKNPGETEKFAERLAEIIRKAEAKNAVPPGLYAEYGYALLSLDRTPEAVEYFAKEQSKWPESAKLMDGVIGRLTRAKVEPAASPTAPAVGDGKAPVPNVPVPTMQSTPSEVSDSKSSEGR